jgi:hypothetical protein
MASELRSIAVNVGHCFEVFVDNGLRQCAECRQQFDTRLLVLFYPEVIAAGLKPGFIGLGFVLLRLFELVTRERGGIAFQRIAQLRQRLDSRASNDGLADAGVTLLAISAAWLSGTSFASTGSARRSADVSSVNCSFIIFPFIQRITLPACDASPAG